MASVEEGELQDSNSSSEEEDNESKQAPSVLKFKNDGSFLEMFKKMQEQNKDSKESNVPKEAEKVSVKSEPSDNSSNISEIKKEEVSQKKPGLLSMVGKRRGGRVLPTGVVKKQRRPDEDDDNEKKDAWSQYMSEVRKYKERLGDEEEKNRPLVK